MLGQRRKAFLRPHDVVLAVLLLEDAVVLGVLSFGEVGHIQSSVLVRHPPQLFRLALVALAEIVDLVDKLKELLIVEFGWGVAGEGEYSVFED